VSQGHPHTTPLTGTRAASNPQANGAYGSLYPYSARTDVGLTRAINEDTILALPPLFVVADGMGGHDAGEVASAITVETIVEYAPHRSDTVALARALKRANKAIIDAVANKSGKPGMGTTCTALMIRDGQCAIAHVGDSRAYLLRDGRLSQITHDHSVVGALMRSGHLTAAEARIHPQRNVITRALGSESDIAVDTYQIPLLARDRLLVCSDGLTSMVEDAYIQQILAQEKTPATATQALIDAANDAGGKDNISAIVIDITHNQSARRRNPHRSILWRWITLWVILAALILGGIGYGINRYAQTRTYLTPTTRGTVDIYQGIPEHIMGITLNSLSLETTVTLDSLSLADQEKIRSHQYVFDSVEQAKEALDAMNRYSKPKQPSSSDAEKKVP
jgi:protein phosphatase